MFGLGVLGSLGTVPGNSGPSYDPAAVAFFARIPAQTPTRYALLNTVFVGLRAAGILSLLDCLWLMAAADSTTARANLISSPFTLTPVAAPTFTADRGYMGDGAGAYLDTNFNPSTAVGAKYAQNSAAVGGWSNTAGQTAGGLVGGVSSGGFNSILLNARTTTDALQARINDASGFQTVSNTDGSGLFVNSRLNSASISVYRNGVSLLSSVADTSGPVPNQSLKLLANGAAAAGFDARQLSSAFISSGLSPTDVANLYSILHPYLQAVGAAA